MGSINCEAKHKCKRPCCEIISQQVLFCCDLALIIIDEAHKLPEPARQMFGVTLDAEDIRHLSRELRTERYYLAADRVLSVIGKQLNDRLSPPVAKRLRGVSNAADALCADDTDMILYTTESESGGTTLCGTVTDLRDRLQNTLWRQPRPTLLASGTLAVGDSFRRFWEETGLTSGYRVIESVSLSPFDYEKNCLLYLPKKPKERSACDTPEYYDQLTTEICSLLAASCGHALVLFNSYIAMSAVKERLLRRKLPWKVYTMSRNAVYTVEQFKLHPGSVLLATGAAWEDFDFPGDSASMLIIPRLPFPYPNVVKEKEREKYDSLHAFIRSIVVPEMQIKLRQGFGRAIRTETDTCVVAILDDRACKGGRYYDDVIAALPKLRQSSTTRAVVRFLRAVKQDAYFSETGNAQLDRAVCE